MKIRLELILVITISVMLTINQTQVGSIVGKNIQDEKVLDNTIGQDVQNYNVESIEETFKIKQDIEENNYVGTFGEEVYTSADQAIGDFTPEVEIEGEFSSPVEEGALEEGSVNLDLPGEGDYNVVGDVNNLRSQYIQNSGAEDSVNFYSDTAVQAGLSLERLSDSRAIDGDYVWKFYSQNIISMAYALYQEDIVC